LGIARADLDQRRKKIARFKEARQPKALYVKLFFMVFFKQAPHVNYPGLKVLDKDWQTHVRWV